MGASVAAGRRSPTDADVLPPCLPLDKELVWNGGSWRLWIQTDNQLLSQVFSGKAVNDSAAMRPLFVRIGRRFRQLLHGRFLPRTNVVPFIEWDERKFNSLADHCANVALDTRSDWQRQNADAISRAKDRLNNIRLSFDGALRGDGRGAGGVVIWSYAAGGGK